MDLSYSHKSNLYMSSIRKDILPLLPNKMKRIMEVGCGTGATLTYLKQCGKADWICGVELSHDAYEQADKTLDLAIHGNIETIDLPLEKESLDLILCLDVVEHLVDPWTILKKIIYYLKPGGLLILSIPNFREIKVLSQIVLNGDFAYTEEGILDNTHLRFFCKKNMLNLIDQTNLHLENIYCTLSGKRRLINLLTLGLMKEFITIRYILSAKK